MGGSIAHYPRQKIAMTETVQLPLVGRFGKRLMTKEELLADFRPHPRARRRSGSSRG